jgi:hypothetical protein
MLARSGASPIVIGCLLLLIELGAGCGDSGTGADAGASGASGSGAMCSAKAGGPVTSPDGPDMHCIDSGGKVIKQVTSDKACNPPADAGIPEPMAMSDEDAGADASEYGPTLYGSEADDDDCKYHVKWTASCIEQNKDVTFKVTVTKKADGTPMTDSAKDPIPLDVFLSETHLGDETKLVSKETASGVYSAGPIRFDAPGKWTVRFHFRYKCVDLTPDSPHGHAAFYVNVP